MSKKLEKLQISELNQMHSSGAGYDVLRYIGLPDLLGREAETLLYFMGKNLARKFEINTLDDLYYIYEHLGWGKLELVKEKRNKLTFHLMSDSVVLRLKAPFETDFRLEAGFLAEAIEGIKETECECMEEINQRIHLVKFSVVYTS
ncbi:YslB family protein [Oceanobacillus bengalensis]|uniref:DUF2507 domain-containing protein n=1 Tax=Oceanobacillus bengalensis TaxID=1435466 RepID=A0A494Z5Z1_9BACI|nr:YslB family protein [Oceanobacillus bengalensis]RKQ17972.1 DUF2507 domain-containing protein [Oceanobacillus bengalensis]